MSQPSKERLKAVPRGLEAEPKGRESLLEDGLLSSWYMQYRAEEEVERAQRHDRPLAILHAAPAFIPGEQANDSLLEAAAVAGRTIARGTDLLGWWDNCSLLIIMPETDLTGAETAASRWKTELYRKTQAAGGHKWNVRVIDGSQLESAQGLFAAPRRAAEREIA